MTFSTLLSKLFGVALVSCGGVSALSIPSEPAKCSTAPPYPNDYKFFYEKATSATVLPKCTPRCDAVTRLNGFYAIDGLPTGNCAATDAACDMAGSIACACPNSHEPLNGDRRRCSSSSWSCNMISQGAGTCGEDRPCSDAGADSRVGVA